MINGENLNVILITIDALRADHLGCYGYYRNTSPNIDKLASNGVLFSQAIANGGGTPEAFPSILASVPPPMHHEECGSIIKENVTITEILRMNGYKTAGFHSNPYLSSFFHYDKGFDTFDDSMALAGFVQREQIKGMMSITGNSFFRLLGTIVDFLVIVSPPIIRAEQITNKAISWLRGNANKFFLWLHYMDVHHPYMPPPKFRRQFYDRPLNRFQMLKLYNKISRKPDTISSNDLERLIGLYDASIKYVDNSIGLLFRELEERLDNTLIIVTADHGEALGEQGRFRHGFLYEGVVRVPLVITAPHIFKSIRVKNQVSSLSITPTIINILNLEKVKSFQGESLLPVIRSEKSTTEPVISVVLNYPAGQRMFSCRTEESKYIYTERINKGEKTVCREFYILENDPGEERNLWKQHRKKAQEFETRILNHTSKVAQERVEKRTIQEKERIALKIKNLNL
ncbi:MAG: sulfatase [Candidatus Hodarchaeota archaeon]